MLVLQPEKIYFGSFYHYLPKYIEFTTKKNQILISEKNKEMFEQFTNY